MLSRRRLARKRRTRLRACYYRGMPELNDEIRELAEQVAASTDEDVLDSGASIAAWYRRERLIALGLAAVDSMVSGGPEEIDENDSRLVAVRERLRDRLRELLEWARKAGKLRPQ